MKFPQNIKALVTLRAKGYCEYCLVHQEEYTVKFQIDHIIPLYHGGKSEEENLAWSCPVCNRGL